VPRKPDILKVGNISNATGIAIGEGASVVVNIHQVPEVTPILRGKKDPEIEIDFAIIAAIEKEAKAVVRRLQNHTVNRFEDNDIRTYHLGTVPIRDTNQFYKVVVILLPSMGGISAANAVTDTLVRWRPRFLLMTGIAGGLPQDDLDLGDVVVSDQVVGYEYGKVSEEGLKSRDRVYPASAMLVERVRNFWNNSWAEQIGIDRPTNVKRARSKLFIGPIASGNKVVASAEFRDQLLARWPKLHAVEMEADGVFAAAFDRPQIVQTLVVRGISDMANKRKSDIWQEYAANAAAAFLISFLESGPVDVQTGAQVSSTAPIGCQPSEALVQPDVTKRMSDDLYYRLRQTLLDCGPFDSDRQLRAVFAHPDLRPWQKSLPQTGSMTERVDEVLDQLLETRTSNGKRLLAILLRVMSARLDPAMACYHRLTGLANEIEEIS
jgi:nucleoside phosphorylase